MERSDFSKRIRTGWDVGGWLGTILGLGLVFFMSGCGILSEAQHPEQFKRYSVQMGLSDYDADEIDDADAALKLGIGTTYHDPGMGGMVGEVDLLYAGLDEQNLETDKTGAFNMKGEIIELALGMRQVFQTGPVEPYFGAGVSLAYYDLTASDPDQLLASLQDDGFSVGGYAHAGVSYLITKRTRWFVDYRYTTGQSIDIQTFESDADNGTFSTGFSIDL